MSKLTLRSTALTELESLMLMERMSDAVEFLTPKSREDHLTDMQSAHGTYLSIYWEDEMVGYLSLILDPDGISVECRRILVTKSGKGIGRLAMLAMETYCQETLGRTRIWLDFFPHNARGRHLYQKLGYQKYGETVCDGKALELYEKLLNVN
ncbi:MAG: GNAT family N-acetyltransferase [Gammaproteobacteria bacterium]|nr:GNAT family N-acetyltransferase [Gammaproteobacteria bacterium]